MFSEVSSTSGKLRGPGARPLAATEKYPLLHGFLLRLEISTTRSHVHRSSSVQWLKARRLVRERVARSRRPRRSLSASAGIGISREVSAHASPTFDRAPEVLFIGSLLPSSFPLPPSLPLSALLCDEPPASMRLPLRPRNRPWVFDRNTRSPNPSALGTRRPPQCSAGDVTVDEVLQPSVAVQRRGRPAQHVREQNITGIQQRWGCATRSDSRENEGGPRFFFRWVANSEQGDHQR